MFKDFVITKETHEAEFFYSKYCIIIFDDDFIETTSIKDHFYKITMSVIARTVIRSIIKIYTSRQLDVARNILLFISEFSNKYHWETVNIIEHLGEYVKEFEPYSKQVKELLVFA